MIESEILEIVSDVEDDGTRLNEIANQFRRGRNIDELLELLDSSNPELVATGAWILGELHFDRYNKSSLLSRLGELTEHESPEVRFQALGALFPSFDRDDSATRTLLSKLSRDPNEGVRKRAAAAAARLSSE